jgi:anaerobic magnesium-protoporphyrin IX monomethyl ester cyclase
MRVVLINPNQIVLPHDPLATNFQMPLGLASVAAVLRAASVDVTVLDAYGQQPERIANEPDYLVLGLNPTELAAQVPPTCGLALLYAPHVVQLPAVCATLRALGETHPHLPVVLLENPQADPAFPLSPHIDDLLEAGADAVLCGEAERAVPLLVKAVAEEAVSMHHIPGLRGAGLTNSVGHPPVLANLPRPAWDLFPVRNYWRAGFARGPVSTGRYLPIEFSRGQRRTAALTLLSDATPPAWRCRTPEQVVENIAALRQEFHINEFHVDDAAPDVEESWMTTFCNLLSAKPWKVMWKIIHPGRPAAFSEATLTRMATAGCRYLAFALDARSANGVPVAQASWDAALDTVTTMNQIGIHTLACLNLGDTEPDLPRLERLTSELARRGLDELEIPGTVSRDGLRRQLSRRLLKDRLRHHPWRVLRQGLNFVLRRFETKAEAATYQSGILRWRTLWIRPPQESPPAAESDPEPAGEPMRRVA